MHLQASLANLVGGDPRADTDVPRPGHGDGFRSGALNYHLPKKKHKTTKLPLTIYHLTPTHAVARSAVADIQYCIILLYQI